MNSRYYTLESIIEKMKEETTGLEVMTVGISLGGFMAAILASSLNAKFCLDFAGQFSLLHHWMHVETNSFLQAMYSKNSNCIGEAYCI